jgi:16S rRNA (guanine966-N2)-methyltransferase
MKITRGSLANKRLIPPKTSVTRPTSEKVRQAVFNMIQHNVDFPDLTESKVLDAFCGTGALGLEALSRGAGHVTFVDNHYEAYKNLCDLCSQWSLRSQVNILLKDVMALGKAMNHMDFVFCDPPYTKGLVMPTLQYLKKMGWISFGTIIIVETDRREELVLDGFELLDDRSYGDTRILFLKSGDKNAE